VSGARNVAGMFAMSVPSVARTQALVSNGVITTVDHGVRNARTRNNALSVSRASNFAAPVAAYKRPACRRGPQMSKYIVCACVRVCVCAGG
jgi:hypothetical protein